MVKDKIISVRGKLILEHITKLVEQPKTNSIVTKVTIKTNCLNCGWLNSFEILAFIFGSKKYSWIAIDQAKKRQVLEVYGDWTKLNKLWRGRRRLKLVFLNELRQQQEKNWSQFF